MPTVSPYCGSSIGLSMSATDWTASQNGVPLPFHRGFTGHEHYDRFGIINMNARLYDPVIARFFSPDPQVQNPFSTQGFNRYSYCGNNPVMFTDPNGELMVITSILAGAIIGSMVNVLTNINNIKEGKIDLLNVALVGAATGIISGAIGNGIAAVLSGKGFFEVPISGIYGFLGGSLSGSSAGFVGGFLTGFGNAMIQNKTFEEACNYGWDYAWKSAIAGFVLGGVMGGVAAIMDERSFFNGSGEGSITLESPVHNNFGKEDGDCVFYALEECSNSYNLNENYNSDYWKELNSIYGGSTDPNDITDFINSSNVFGAQNTTCPEGIIDAFKNNGRILIANSEHMAIVNKIRVWPSGKFTIWISETSPVRIFDKHITIIPSELLEYRFWHFFKL